MLEVTFAGWAATLGLIVGLFALDLFVSRPGRAHVIEFKEAALASVYFVSVAVAFGVAFGILARWDFGTEYFAGYIVEKSLSGDNLFVFVVILSAFAVPPEHHQRVLTFGILLALLMRVVLLDRLVYLSSGLSLILAFIGVKLMLHYGHLQNEDIPEIATSTSLLVIVGVLAVTVVASVVKIRRDPDARAHAGRLHERRESDERRK